MPPRAPPVETVFLRELRAAQKAAGAGSYSAIAALNPVFHVKIFLFAAWQSAKARFSDIRALATIVMRSSPA
jgi:hypothetical protein